MADTAKEDSLKKEHTIQELYFLLYTAASFLEEEGFNFNKSEFTRNPKGNTSDMVDMISIALAEHGNTPDGVAMNIRSIAPNSNNTTDWGLWQINDGEIAYKYLTSQHEHTNANISIFKNVSKSEFRKLLMNPFYNAIAAVAMANLYQDDEGYVFQNTDTHGINNWSTVQQGKIDTTKALQEVSALEGKREVQNRIMDNHLEYWNDIFQTKISNINPNPEILVPEPKEETAVWDFNFKELVNNSKPKSNKLPPGSNPVGDLFKEVFNGRK